MIYKPVAVFASDKFTEILLSPESEILIFIYLQNYKNLIKLSIIIHFWTEILLKNI